MDFPTLNINPKSRLLYIKNSLYKKLGPTIKAVPNSTAILLFKENESLENVLTSIDTIRQDIEHAIKTKKLKEKNDNAKT